MKGAFQLCLILYPREHRDRFAEEMTQVFEQAAEERRALGWTWYVTFALGEIVGLLVGAAEAWMRVREVSAPKPVAKVAAASSSYVPQELLEAQQRVDANVAAMVQAIANHQFERARFLSNQEREARANLTSLREKYGMEDDPGYQCS
jgi:post-segregation antitoxin (ccd killing protein)